MNVVQPDWQLVKVDQTKHCNEHWLKRHGITACGVYYLVDFNRHVYCCELTPSLEAFPVQGWAEYSSHEAFEKDEGNAEMEMLNSEEAVTYYKPSVFDKLPTQSAANYIPDREDEEDDETYYKRIPDAVYDHLCGNPVGF